MRWRRNVSTVVKQSASQAIPAAKQTREERQHVQHPAAPAADGFAFLNYLAGYGAARFSVEFFRGEPAIFAWGIPAAQVFGVTLVLAAIAAFGTLRLYRAAKP